MLYNCLHIIFTKNILKSLNLGEGGKLRYLDRISSQTGRTLDLVGQGTPLQNEIQFQQNLIGTNCRSRGGYGVLEFGISQPQCVVRGIFNKLHSKAGF